MSWGTLHLSYGGNKLVLAEDSSSASSSSEPYFRPLSARSDSKNYGGNPNKLAAAAPQSQKRKSSGKSDKHMELNSEEAEQEDAEVIAKAPTCQGCGGKGEVGCHCCRFTCDQCHGSGKDIALISECIEELRTEIADAECKDMIFWQRLRDYIEADNIYTERASFIMTAIGILMHDETKFKELLNSRNGDNGTTLLHICCRRQNVTLVADLLNKAADPVAIDNDGRTPLAFAMFLRAPDTKFEKRIEGTSLVRHINVNPDMLRRLYPAEIVGANHSIYTAKIVYNCILLFLCASDFVLDVFFSEALAHSDIHQIKPIGYTCASLMVLTAINNVRVVRKIMKKHKGVFNEMRLHYPCSVAVTSLLSVTNVDALSIIISCLDSSLSGYLQGAVLSVTSDIKAQALPAQLFEDIPQPIAQIFAFLIQSQHGQPIPLIGKFSVSLSAILLAHKVMAKMVCHIFPFDIDLRTFQVHLHAKARILTNLDDITNFDVFAMVLEFLVFLINITFVLCLCNFESLQAFMGSSYGLIGIAVIVLSEIACLIFVVQYLSQNGIQRMLAHVLLDAEVAGCVLLVATVHPLFLLLLGNCQRLNPYLHDKSTRPAILHTIVAMRDLGIACLATWGMWKSHFAIEEYKLVSVVIANGIGLAFNVLSRELDDNTDVIYELVETHEFSAAFSLMLDIFVEHATSEMRSKYEMSVFSDHLIWLIGHTMQSVQRMDTEVDLNLLKFVHKLRGIALQWLEQTTIRVILEEETVTSKGSMLQILLEVVNYAVNATDPDLQLKLLPKSHPLFSMCVTIASAEELRSWISEFVRGSEGHIEMLEEIVRDANSKKHYASKLKSWMPIRDNKIQQLFEEVESHIALIHLIGNQQFVGTSDMQSKVKSISAYDCLDTRLLARAQYKIEQVRAFEEACRLIQVPRILACIEKAEVNDDLTSIKTKGNYFVNRVRSTRKAKTIFEPMIDVVERLSKVYEGLNHVEDLDAPKDTDKLLEALIDYNITDQHFTGERVLLEDRKEALQQRLVQCDWRCSRYLESLRDIERLLRPGGDRAELRDMLEGILRDLDICEASISYICDCGVLLGLTPNSGAYMIGDQLNLWMQPLSEEQKSKVLEALLAEQLRVASENTTTCQKLLADFVDGAQKIMGGEKSEEVCDAAITTGDLVTSTAVHLVDPTDLKNAVPKIKNFLKSMHPVHSCSARTLKQILDSKCLKCRSSLPKRTGIKEKLKQHDTDLKQWLRDNFEAGAQIIEDGFDFVFDFAATCIHMEKAGPTHGAKQFRRQLEQKLTTGLGMKRHEFDTFTEHIAIIGSKWEDVNDIGVSYWLDEVLNLQHRVFTVLGPNTDYGPISLILKKEVLEHSMTSVFVNSATTYATGTCTELRPWMVCKELAVPWDINSLVKSMVKRVPTHGNKTTIQFRSALRRATSTRLRKEHAVKNDEFMRLVIARNTLSLAANSTDRDRTWDYIAQEIFFQGKLALSKAIVDRGHEKNWKFWNDCTTEVKRAIQEICEATPEEVWKKRWRMRNGRYGKLTKPSMDLSIGTRVEVLPEEHEAMKQVYVCVLPGSNFPCNILKEAVDFDEDVQKYEDRCTLAYQAHEEERHKSEAGNEILANIAHTCIKKAVTHQNTWPGRVLQSIQELTSLCTVDLSFQEITADDIVKMYSYMDTHGRCEVHLSGSLDVKHIEAIVCCRDGASHGDVEWLQQVSKELGLKLMIAKSREEAVEFQLNYMLGKLIRTPSLLSLGTADPSSTMEGTTSQSDAQALHRSES